MTGTAPDAGTRRAREIPEGPFDRIVVGSGINGLVAAAMLAGRGRRVLVLEREDRLGGCIRSDALTLPGFTHDTLAATWVLFVTGPAMAALGADLARHGLEFAQGPIPTGVLRPDGSHLVARTDREANRAAFDALCPGDGEAHAAEVRHVEDHADLLFGLLGGRVWSRSTARLLARSAWRGGPRGLLDRLGQTLIPSRAWLETRFSSDLVRALWAPWCLHAGLGPEAAFSGEMARVIAFALEAAGAPVVKGGAGRAVAAFRGLIEERGGVLVTGADVAEITVAKGRATGVRLATGERIAARGVLASVTPGQLYGRLLSAEAAGEKRREAERFRHGRANFQMHYALDAPPDWGAADLARTALLHLTDGLDAVSKAVNEAERGLLPAAPTICVGQPCAMDPTRAPEGKAVLWLQMPEAPRVVRGDAAGEIEAPEGGRWTPDLAEAYADRIEGVLRRHVANFDAVALRRRVLSPADLEAMNCNLVGGDPYGGAASIDQFFLWRPFTDSVNHRTPVEGLLHIGASTHPGPGLGGGSGFLAAQGG